MFTIYLITNKLNGKIYVGQTEQKLRRRWGLHKSRANHDDGLYTAHLYNAMRLYGIDAFEIKEIATCETEEWSNYLETLYILLYDSTNPKVGYNMTSGGDRPVRTPEGIEKHRQKMLGRVRTPETKQKTSDSLKLAYQEGRHPGNGGKSFSEEQKAAWSERITGSGHWNFNHKICPEELVSLWNNGVFSKDIAKHFGISRSTVSRRVKATGLPYHDYSAPGGRSGIHSPKYKGRESNLLPL